MTDLTQNSQLQRLQTVLAETIDRVHSDLIELAENYRGMLTLQQPEGRVEPFSPEQIADLRTLSEQFLIRHPITDGAGFVFNPDRVIASDQIFQWWVRGSEGIEPYGFVYDPESSQCYDFTTLPWYSVPANSGQPKFAGPYIDFLGVDGFIVTFSQPLIVADKFIGVATADIPVAKIERLFFEHVSNIPAIMALTSTAGRIIAVNSSQFMPGDNATLENDDTVVSIPTTVPTMNLVIREVNG